MNDTTPTRDELLAELEALRHEVGELRQRVAGQYPDPDEIIYRELVQSANTIVLRWDLQGRVTFLNDFGLEFFGYASADLVGRSVVGTIVPETETSGRDLAQMIADLLADPDRYVNNENENLRRSGERVWITWRNRTLCDGAGRVRELLSIGMDTSERKRAEDALRDSEERFRFLSVHDSLTGLFNQRYLYEKLSTLLAADGAACAVIFMDLDRFKHVVDTVGHLNGSRAIREVAQAIQACIREPAFAVAYAGDEFVIVLPGWSKVHALATAHDIRAQVGARTFLTEVGHAVRLGASFGVAAYPDDAPSMETLLAVADQALFKAKATGRGTVTAAGAKPLP